MTSDWNVCYLDTTLQMVSFYSPDFEKLLRYICDQNSYSVKHPDLNYWGGDKYNIDDHCVEPLNGNIEIRIDGVAFDQYEIELDEFMIGYKKANKTVKTNNKFHVRLPPK